MSGDGLPPLLAKFWRHLAHAVPARSEGQAPHNVTVLVHWIAAETARRESERDKRIGGSLLWFIKGLALTQSDDALRDSAHMAKKRWQAVGGVARKARMLSGLTCPRCPPPLGSPARSASCLPSSPMRPLPCASHLWPLLRLAGAHDLGPAGQLEAAARPKDDAGAEAASPRDLAHDRAPASRSS